MHVIALDRHPAGASILSHPCDWDALLSLCHHVSELEIGEEGVDRLSALKKSQRLEGLTLRRSRPFESIGQLDSILSGLDCLYAFHLDCWNPNIVVGPTTSNPFACIAAKLCHIKSLTIDLVDTVNNLAMLLESLSSSKTLHALSIHTNYFHRDYSYDIKAYRLALLDRFKSRRLILQAGGFNSSFLQV